MYSQEIEMIKECMKKENCEKCELIKYCKKYGKIKNTPLNILIRDTEEIKINEQI